MWCTLIMRIGECQMKEYNGEHNECKRALELFEEIADIKSDIRDCKIEKERLEEQIGPPNQDFSKEGIKGTSNSTFAEYFVLKLEEVKGREKNLTVNLEETIIEANKILEKLEDLRERQVLTYIFVNGYSAKIVAEKLNYSESQIRRLKKTGLETLEKIINMKDDGCK